MRVFVPIIIERARLGGERWSSWRSGGQRRRAASYLALGARVCRCRVGARRKYATQRPDVVDPARIRAERVARRAGLDLECPMRPKGMHRARYARAPAARRAAEAEWDRPAGEAFAGFALRRGWIG
jgi:hypothetical protein